MSLYHKNSIITLNTFYHNEHAEKPNRVGDLQFPKLDHIYLLF